MAGELARAFVQDRSPASLRRAAIALIIEGGATDLRDTFLAFEHLRGTAMRYGIDADEVFNSIPGFSEVSRSTAHFG